MDISSVLASIKKRWYVALTVLVLTGVAAQQLWQSAEPEYSATTTLTVLPTPSLMQARAEIGAGESSLGNPFGIEATTVLAALLSDSINNGEVSLSSSVGPSSVGALADSSPTAKPYFTVLATSSTPQGVLATLDTVSEQSVAILAEIQSSAGSPSEQLYTALRTRPIEAVSVGYPQRSRTVLGVVLAGLLLAALLSVALDAALSSRSRRRAGGRTRS